MLENLNLLNLGPDMDWENSDRLLTDIEKQGIRSEESDTITPFKIKVSAGVGGTASPSETDGYPYRTISINIVPDSGYWISRITDNGEESVHWFSGLTSFTYLLYNVDRDHDIQVEFEKYSEE